jgi:hypothetical protein
MMVILFHFRINYLASNHWKTFRKCGNTAERCGDHSGLKLAYYIGCFWYGILYRVSESLESMGILIIFLIFIYRLTLKVKRLKLALTLDEKVEIVFLSGRQG